ncbi:MAG: hypothetical protein ACK5OB_02270, partial [Pirellula sp.]
MTQTVKHDVIISSDVPSIQTAFIHLFRFLSLSAPPGGESMSVKSFFTNGLRAVGVLLVAMMANAFSPVADAAVVVVDLTSPVDIRGPNAGLAPGDRHSISDYPFTGVRLQISNNRSGGWGLDGDSGLRFSVLSDSANANPRNFSAGTRIDSNATFSSLDLQTRFRALD